MKVICPYCHAEAKLVSGEAIYPHRPDLHHGHYWLCIPCDAYVGTHKNSKDNAPLGRLANAELRRAKMTAHAVFDPLWKKGKMNRSEAYAWLAEQLGIEPKYCHIGMFDVEKCKAVVSVIRENMRQTA